MIVKVRRDLRRYQSTSKHVLQSRIMKAMLLSLVLQISEKLRTLLMFHCLNGEKNCLYVWSEPPYSILYLLSHILSSH